MADPIRDFLADTQGDIQIDPETGDLAVTSGGESVAQDATQRLRTFRGEWFLDIDFGVPYFDSVLVKNPNPSLLQTIFRDKILETPGMVDLVTLDLDYDSAERELDVRFKGQIDTGEIVSVEVEL